MRVVYCIENLDCAHCAGEIERAISALPEIASVSLDFPSKRLHLVVESKEGILEKIQSVADGIEDGVVFREKGQEETHHHDGEKNEIVRLAIGAGLFAAGMVLHFLPVADVLAKLLLLAAYLVMGAGVLVSSFKSILKGRIFDENFLMSIATIGALVLGCWEEAAGVMLFFRAGELFEHIAVEKSRKSIMDAIDLRPEKANLIMDGEICEVLSQKIQPGDLLLVRAGDRIPVDGVIEKGESALDTSAMTGESIPRHAAVGDTVMSGCINLNGALEIRASACLQDSMVQRVLDSVENAAARKPKIDRFITRFARVYTPLVVAVAVVTAVVPSLVTGDWSKWIYTALNFLMISCPCALVLSVPLAFFAGIGAGSRKGILFKNGMSLEALSGIRSVVMDKTGTLTEGKFTVTSVISSQPERLLAVCAACEYASTHPIARSIVEYVQERGIPFVPADAVSEIAGRGITGIVEGAAVACGNAYLMAEQGIEIEEDSLAGSRVHVSADGEYLGTLVLSDAPKSGAKTTIAVLRSLGLHTVMLTGDRTENAKEIADALQIDEVHSELLPTQKPEYLEQIRKQHGSVLFVGDGINDAPVLSGADVGAAMGSGADAAMEAADLVILNSDPRSILTSLSIAQRVNRTAKFNIAFALGVKLLIMILGFAGYANMWLSVFADTGVTILCVIFVLCRVQFWNPSKDH